MATKTQKIEALAVASQKVQDAISILLAACQTLANVGEDGREDGEPLDPSYTFIVDDSLDTLYATRDGLRRRRQELEGVVEV